MSLVVKQRSIIGILLMAALYLFSACATSKPKPVAAGANEFKPSQTTADSIAGQIPDYSISLETVKGKGKAIISEPENSQRATLYFASNRQKSLITAKNSIGIEGGKLLADGDSLLIYNKVDDYARIISIRNNDLQRINNLASINLLEILNIPVRAGQIEDVLEHENTYLLRLKSGGKIFVNKKTLLVRQVDQPTTTGLPYSRILYDAYDKVNGLTLPRKITIFSADKSAKINLLIQSLQVNPKLDELKIDLPPDIKIYRQ